MPCSRRAKICFFDCITSPHLCSPSGGSGIETTIAHPGDGGGCTDYVVWVWVQKSWWSLLHRYLPGEPRGPDQRCGLAWQQQSALDEGHQEKIYPHTRRETCWLSHHPQSLQGSSCGVELNEVAKYFIDIHNSCSILTSDSRRFHRSTAVFELLYTATHCLQTLARMQLAF